MSNVLTKRQRRHALVGPPKLWETKRDFQIQFLKARGLAPEHHFLDIGCGTLRHLSDDGSYYANVNIGEKKERSWQGFPVVWRAIEIYRQKCSKYGLNVTDLGPLKDHGHVSNVKSQDSQRMLRISEDRNFNRDVPAEACVSTQIGWLLTS